MKNMNKQVVELRPYAFICCEQFAFELCKEQGWFGEKKFSELTESDKKEAYWLNNWQIAVRSYVFWSDNI